MNTLSLTIDVEDLNRRSAGGENGERFHRKSVNDASVGKSPVIATLTGRICASRQAGGDVSRATSTVSLQGNPD